MAYECTALSSDEAESIVYNFSMGYDYRQDWVNLKDCTTIEELISAMNDSPTEMYTAYDLSTGDEIEELTEQFKTRGIAFEFPQVKAFMLSYPLYNMNFHWGEGIDWDWGDSQHEFDIENFSLTRTAWQAGMLCQKIDEILECWDDKARVDRILRLMRLYGCTSGGICPTDTTLQSIEKIVASFMWSVTFLVNNHSSTESVTNDWSHLGATFLTNLSTDTINANETFEQPAFSEEEYAEFEALADSVNSAVTASLSVPSKKMSEIVEWAKANNYVAQDEASIKQMLKDKGIKPNIKTVYAYISNDLLRKLPDIPAKFVQKETLYSSMTWLVPALPAMKTLIAMFDELLANPADEVVFPRLVQFASDTGLTFVTSKKTYAWSPIDRGNVHVKALLGIDQIVACMEALRSTLGHFPYNLRSRNYVDSVYKS